MSHCPAEERKIMLITEQLSEATEKRVKEESMSSSSEVEDRDISYHLLTKQSYSSSLHTFTQDIVTLQTKVHPHKQK